MLSFFKFLSLLYLFFMNSLVLLVAQLNRIALVPRHLVIIGLLINQSKILLFIKKHVRQVDKKSTHCNALTV